MTLCCYEMDTPQTVYDGLNDDYAEGTDVFDMVFDTVDTDMGSLVSVFNNEEMMKSALWARWRDHMFAYCTVPEFVRHMADTLMLVGWRWDDILSKQSNTDLTDLTDRSYDRTIKHEPIDNIGDVRTISHEGSDIVVNESEDMPQTPVGSTQYLSNRDKTTSTPGVTDTDTFKPNTKDTETYAESNTIAAKTFAEMMKNYPNLMRDFADEFAEHFLHRWYA